MPRSTNKQQSSKSQQRDRTEQFQNILVTLANRFITMTSDRVDEGINDALAELGTFAEVDRSWIIKISKEAGTNTHERKEK